MASLLIQNKSCLAPFYQLGFISFLLTLSPIHLTGHSGFLTVLQRHRPAPTYLRTLYLLYPLPKCSSLRYLLNVLLYLFYRLGPYWNVLLSNGAVPGHPI